MMNMQQMQQQQQQLQVPINEVQISSVAMLHELMSR
jgi:hypothetical protein